MPDHDDRTAQELEFVMDGITTRMQTALEKMNDANRMMSDAVRESNRTTRHVCAAFVIVLILVIVGLIAHSRMWISHVDDLRAGGVVSAVEEIPQLRTGANDR